ncbi:MAG: sulfite exporter TauE/SafE family protein [Halobacteriaceae archaeon]
MATPLPPATAAVLGIVFFGGFVKGVTGFGYAIASTAILATVLDPATAVVVMILPMLAANVSLLSELDREDVPDCVRRFWPYLGAAVVGTLLGMALLDAIPKPALALGLGTFTGLYVLLTQPYRTLPGEAWLRDRCFRTGTPAKAALGLVSGVVFGASNIGVQVVAYLDSLSLDRQTFVGVLSMILVGVGSVRVAAAWSLGLYDARGVLALSGLAGVVAGGRLRRFVPEAYQTAGTLALLAVIAARLTYAGATGL